MELGTLNKVTERLMNLKTVCKSTDAELGVTLALSEVRNMFLEQVKSHSEEVRQLELNPFNDTRRDWFDINDF